MSPGQITVYFDGACHLCSHEIDLYKKVDTEKRLKYVDISSPGFDATSEGLDPIEAKINFHVKDRDGNIHKGVQGYQLIWDELRIFKPLSWIYDQSLGRIVMDAGYKIFTKIRPLLPRKTCESGTCAIH